MKSSKCATGHRDADREPAHTQVKGDAAQVPERAREGGWAGVVSCSCRAIFSRCFCRLVVAAVISKCCGPCACAFVRSVVFFNSSTITYMFSNMHARHPCVRVCVCVCGFAPDRPGRGGRQARRGVGARGRGGDQRVRGPPRRRVPAPRRVRPPRLDCGYTLGDYWVTTGCLGTGTWPYPLVCHAFVSIFVCVRVCERERERIPARAIVW